MKKLIKFMLSFWVFAFIVLSLGVISVAPPILLGKHINRWFASLLIITAPLYGYVMYLLISKTKVIVQEILDGKFVFGVKEK